MRPDDGMGCQCGVGSQRSVGSQGGTGSQGGIGFRGDHLGTLQKVKSPVFTSGELDAKDLFELALADRSHDHDAAVSPSLQPASIEHYRQKRTT